MSGRLLKGGKGSGGTGTGSSSTTSTGGGGVNYEVDDSSDELNSWNDAENSFNSTEYAMPIDTIPLGY